MPLNLQERPIFMIGAERSGTTLVMALLGCHSRIAVPEVVWYYPRFYPYLHTYGDLSVEANFRTLAQEMVFGLKTPFWGMKVNPRTIVDEVIELAPERSFAGLYAGMHLRFAQYVNKPRWGEKTPHNLYFVGPMHHDFPNAQFIYITRDGRDASVDYMESSFGPTNIYCAAQSWKRCWNAVKEWREPLREKGLWLDVRYEELVREPEKVMRGVCEFLGEDFEEGMFEFYKTDMCKARGASRDHAPLGKPISDKYVGIHKDLLSLRDQRIFAAVAGKELEEAGYTNTVEPEMPAASVPPPWMALKAISYMKATMTGSSTSVKNAARRACGISPRRPRSSLPVILTKNTSSVSVRPTSGRSTSPSSAAMLVMLSFRTPGHL